MKKFVLVLFVVISFKGFAQKIDTLYIGFWNQENFYDIVDDPKIDDKEFLPGSEKQWTLERYQAKNENHAKVVLSMNDNKGPDLLGMCEVENKDVLENFTKNYLKIRDYQFVHYDSPDERGIDNAMIYDAKKFKLIKTYADTVVLPSGYSTRSIVTGVFKLKNNETLVVIINHFPSRRGGEKESEQNRVAAATKLKERVNFFTKKDPNVKIIIMGDFNDEPNNVSIKETLGADSIDCRTKLVKGNLYNLAYNNFASGFGSYLYKGDWNMLDQIICSTGLLKSKKTEVVCNSFEVYKPEFTVTQSGTYKGSSRPTYAGNKYLAGFSDHFPVVAKFVIKGIKK